MIAIPFAFISWHTSMEMMPPLEGRWQEELGQGIQVKQKSEQRHIPEESKLSCKERNGRTRTVDSPDSTEEQQEVELGDRET